MDRSGSSHRRLSGRALLVGAAIVALTAAACGGDASESQGGGGGGDGAGAGGDSGGLTIVMDEFSFIPETVTVAAGSEVDVTIVNDGNKPHELMVGMPAGGGPEWETDLFGMMDPEAMGGEGYHLEGAGGHMEGEEDEEEGHGMGHGAEVEVDPGGQVVLRMHVPDDATGEWEMGCFLTGHYEAGMHGTLVVE